MFLLKGLERARLALEAHEQPKLDLADHGAGGGGGRLALPADRPHRPARSEKFLA